ncbi:hypothetical protein FDR95_17760 [Rhizobiaceae bacterium LC148]|nr:hypothetical protein FDR95_17760 [Rhizobiaceae bacterium LC148]
MVRTCPAVILGLVPRICKRRMLLTGLDPRDKPEDDVPAKSETPAKRRRRSKECLAYRYISIYLNDHATLSRLSGA